MKKKRKDRWDVMEPFIRGWINMNKNFYACLPDQLKAWKKAMDYCECHGY